MNLYTYIFTNLKVPLANEEFRQQTPDLACRLVSRLYKDISMLKKNIHTYI